jgi:uncharacterized membrane protein YfcA
MDSLWFLLPTLVVLAALYASVGHGGASGYLALLSLTTLGTGAPWLKSHALCLNVLVAALAFFFFRREGHFQHRLTWPFVVTSIPMAMLGGALRLPEVIYDTLLSLTLLWAAWRLAKSALANIDALNGPPPVPVALATGGAIGLTAGMVGVGGGVFLSPLLVLLGWADAKTTAATSAVFILVNSLAGLAGMAATHQFQVDGSLLGPFAIAVGVGGLVGARLGARKASETTVRRLLAAVLVVAATRRVIGMLL